MSEPLLPLFVKLAGRAVLVVGGGPMAAARVHQLRAVGARVTVVAPRVRDEIAAAVLSVRRREFRPGDLDGAWFAVAAAPAEVNRQVAAAAEERHILVNAVDDPETATAYTGGVVRRGEATVAISTGGRAPALTGLLREAIDAVLPADLGLWVDMARRERPRWKREGVPLATRRPLLLQTLNALYDARPATRRGSFPPGFVSLVGAGPGGAALLTQRAVERLSQADVVLYDALVDEDVLRMAPRAHCFFVGKRAALPSVSQRAIERLLVRSARRGQRVVRLKCGDPFVFGRGGEEAQALAAAGVPFEVVPGVSAAVAAPALAGIPVTHRGLASGFVVVSGHSERTYGPLLDGIAPGALTVVVMMGVGERRGVAARLLARGWSGDTPAVIVSGASSDGASTWRGALATLGDAELADTAQSLPGTIVIGRVAGLRLRPSSFHAAETSPPDAAELA